MDWNWFFSSVAQSAAAIVGIFSAFIITKIINNQNDHSRKTRLLRELLIAAETLQDESKSRYFDWYNRETNKHELGLIRKDVIESGKILDTNNYLQEFKFSPFSNIQELKEKIQRTCNIALKNKQTKEAEAQRGTYSHVSALSMHAERIEEASWPTLYPNLLNERERIDALIIKINHHCKHIHLFLQENNINPESSSLITISLILSTLLFFTGVIYPLSFLPLETNSEVGFSILSFFTTLFSIKWAILFVISIIFTAITSFFFIANVRLKYDKDALHKLASVSEIINYSDYFKNMVEYKQYLSSFVDKNSTGHPV